MIKQYVPILLAYILLVLAFCRNTVQIKKLDPLSHIVYACLDIVAGPPGR